MISSQSIETIFITFLKPIEYSVKIDTVKSGWSIIYVAGSQVIYFKKILYIDFVLANSADSDEMLHFIWVFIVCQSACLGFFWYICCGVTGYIYKKNIVFHSLKIDFVLANSEDPDEMLHNAAFHLDLHYLPKYPFWGSGQQRVDMDMW